MPSPLAFLYDSSGDPHPVGEALGYAALGLLAAAAAVSLARRLLPALLAWWAGRRRWPGVPVDAWRRAGLGVQPSQGVVAFGAGQRCPLCRVEHRPTSEAARCDGCAALFHLACVRELGRCSTLCCAGTARRVAAVHAPG